MLPGIAYYMSRWYRRAELTFRLSLYIVMASLAGAFGGLLASAILKLEHFGKFHGWQMIFGEPFPAPGLTVVAAVSSLHVSSLLTVYSQLLRASSPLAWP